MNVLPTLRGTLSPGRYLVVAPLLLLAQHGLVFAAYQADGSRLVANGMFWLFPLSRLTALPHLQPWAIAAAFLAGLAIIWWLTALSFKRAAFSRRGYALAASAVIPGIQYVAVAVLALLPVRQAADDDATVDGNVGAAHVVQGVIAGAGLIVGAVLLSALTFGAYGWGLFVGTPFVVGVTTAYFANRRGDAGWDTTMGAVAAAAGIGAFALVTFALEGFVCLVLASPLVAIVALLGGVLGRAIALLRVNGRNPVACVAILPACFALEGAMPPSAVFQTQESVLVEASAERIWEELISDKPVAMPGGLVGDAGLAYPLRSNLQGVGIGATRLGHFSTGVAIERVTGWRVGRRLEFEVISQPPAMEEMSPYRKVHAPHVIGYFKTGKTRFEIEPLNGGRTRLTVLASHRLKIDPIPYWEPMARWAASANASRVLQDIRIKAEAPRG